MDFQRSTQNDIVSKTDIQVILINFLSIENTINAFRYDLWSTVLEFIVFLLLVVLYIVTNKQEGIKQNIKQKIIVDKD